MIRAPLKLSPYLAYKGSVAVNGVSLTINSVEDTAMGALISDQPHSAHDRGDDALKRLKPQSYVNLEIDTIARYVERMVLAQGKGRRRSLLREASQSFFISRLARSPNHECAFVLPDHD